MRTVLPPTCCETVQLLRLCQGLLSAGAALGNPGGAVSSVRRQGRQPASGCQRSLTEAERVWLLIVAWQRGTCFFPRRGKSGV
jgi:hypothetical protein